MLKTIGDANYHFDPAVFTRANLNHKKQLKHYGDQYIQRLIWMREQEIRMLETTPSPKKKNKAKITSMEGKQAKLILKVVSRLADLQLHFFIIWRSVFAFNFITWDIFRALDELVNVFFFHSRINFYSLSLFFISVVLGL